VLLVAAAAATAGVIALLLFEHDSSRHLAAVSQRPPKAHAKPRRSILKPGFASLVGPPLSARLLSPPVRARAAIVIDDRSGRVLWAFHPHRRLPIASTTKIMTAYVALPRLRANALVRVAPAITRVPLVKEGLRPHERVRAWKLFRGMLIYSGNDDALALAMAAASSRSAFVRLMNETARRLGLMNSHFSTPSGVIDAGNYSSAWDLATLTRNGVKTGWTTLAGHCLVASATRHGRTIIVVLLHDARADRDARRLLDLGFATRA
jgi:D-alanyl-D-alanine carboxypeptidase